jgi:hypothetical protein
MTIRKRIDMVKEFVRHPFAWPGGYSLFLVMSDGAALCHKCTKKEFRNILDACKRNDNSGWRADSVAINYEDDDSYCCHCSEKIDPEYSPE